MMTALTPRFLYLLIGGSLLFLFLACSESSIDDFTNEPAGPADTTSTDKRLTYLALGDSYTIGESVAESERFPVQLADSLRRLGIEIAPPTIIARTGWRTDDLQAAIAKANLRAEYDLVTLLIGVNNQYQSRPINVYRKEFRELLEKSLQLAGGDTSRVFVVSIPDYAYTPFGGGSDRISREIDEYNAINREISRSYGVHYFNITPISREGLQKPELVARDGLHPSGRQYTRWVELMLPEITRMLKE